MEIRPLLFALSRSKTGPLLLAAQVALTFVVIVSLAFVIAQSLEASSRPIGMDLHNMFWLTTQPSSGTVDRASHAAAVKAELAWLNAQPGVVAAATAAPLPESFSDVGVPLAAYPHELERPGGGHFVPVYMGSERIIDALGLELIAGRNFKPDAVQPPAVTPAGISPANVQASLVPWAPEIIVTQELARELFPHEPALGKTVHAGLVNKPAVIVGIVKLFRSNPQLDRFATRVAIVPLIPAGPNGVYVVRTQPGRRDELMARAAKALGELQPNRFVSRLEAYDVTAARARASYHTAIIMLSAAAALVLLVTVVGIVGLAAYNVAARTRQLGTRRALGARRFHILRYFLLENWLTTTAGLALGCPLALAAGVQLSRTFQMPHFPLYYLTGGVLLMWLVGLLAVLLPALRAASTPPAVATRVV